MEYVLYASADLTTEKFSTFIANATGGEVLGNFVRSDALDVTAREEDPDEVSPIAGILGFEHRVTATFRLSNRATEEARDEATRTMIRVVLAFFNDYPAYGVLLFNNERVILQRVDGPVVIDSSWEDWAEVPGMQHLVAGLERRHLAQPLL
ncbi:hypothetical protein C6W10_08720 [Plantactinospora sp. BB1]|nr:hypothetical protein C6W10_08720 [Plantactinospora sp. BB1]